MSSTSNFTENVSKQTKPNEIMTFFYQEFKI